MFGLLGGFDAHRTETAVELQTIVDHALGGEAFAGAGVGQLCVGAAHGAVGIEQANIFGEAGGVVGTEIESGVPPDLAEAGDVISHDGASRKRGMARKIANALFGCSFSMLKVTFLPFQVYGVSFEKAFQVRLYRA